MGNIKVKTALLISTLSLSVLGVGVTAFVDKSNISDSELLEYVKKNNNISPSILNKEEKEGLLVYTLKSNNSGLVFNAYVDTSTQFPTIQYDTYKTSLDAKVAETKILPSIPKIKELGFNTPDSFVDFAVDTEGDTVTLLTVSYADTLSLFELTDKTYEDIYGLIEQLKSVDIDNLHVEIVSDVDGKFVLGQLDRFDSVKSVKSYIVDLFMVELDRLSEE